MDEPVRHMKWWGKWLFGSYAAAFGIYLLAGVLAIPFWGYDVLESVTGKNGPAYLFLLMVITGPFMYKRLK